MADDPARRLLTAGEVAVMFRVAPETVARWARQGKLTEVRVPGGDGPQFPEDEIRALLKPAP